MIFQYEPTFVSLDRGRCPRTLSEVWKIQLKTEFAKYIKSEDPKDPRILYIWQTLSEAYIFHAEDIVRGHGPLSVIYHVALNYYFVIFSPR